MNGLRNARDFPQLHRSLLFARSYRTLASQYLVLAEGGRNQITGREVRSSASVRELRPEGRPLLKEARRAHSYFNRRGAFVQCIIYKSFPIWRCKRSHLTATERNA